MEDYNKSIGNNQYKDKYIYNWIKSTLESLGCTMPGDNENNDSNDNNINNDNNNNDNNEENEIVRSSTNNRSTSTNINKNRMNNSDKKRESVPLVEKSKFNKDALNKKSSIIVKKLPNNSINNRYNISHNIHSSINNINVTKSSILGSSNISNTNKITIQKNNLKNSQVYKGNVKNKKKK